MMHGSMNIKSFGAYLGTAMQWLTSLPSRALCPRGRNLYYP